MKISPIVENLIEPFIQEVPVTHVGTGYNVSRMVSIFAVIFEKARNAVEFRAEHLIRRAAIERILKRRILLNGSASAVSSSLITELLWARYIDSSLIDEQKENEITLIIDKYLTLRQAITAGHANIPWDFVLGIASSEIDELLFPARRRDALLYFFYQAMRPKISLAGYDEEQTNLVAIVAAERAYMKSDDALIAFHILKLSKLTWSETTGELNQEKVSEFAQLAASIRSALTDPVVPPVFRYLRRQIAPFLLLGDFLYDVGKNVNTYLDDSGKLDEKLSEIAMRKYNETGKRVRTAMVRSFIYIFLTKMLFALALEAPYDIYIAKKLSILPLLVNTLFPPFMLFFIAGLFSVPGLDNTKRLIDRIKKLLYDFDNVIKESDTYVAKQRVRRPVLGMGFSLIYLITFAITFGIINFILNLLTFSLPSKIIFVFFVALVSFFAYRIRQSAKEYEIIERQGFLEPIMDFFLMPILQAGQFLSNEISKLNIFIFLFDFILEAPLKTIFELIEEWIRFVRVKKEEIV